MVTKAPLWKFAEQTPSGSQTRLKSATTQAQPVTSTAVKPAGPRLSQAPAQAQPQAPAVPSESLIDEERVPNFPESEASLIPKQDRSELLDRVANFCAWIRERGH